MAPHLPVWLARKLGAIDEPAPGEEGEQPKKTEPLGGTESQVSCFAHRPRVPKEAGKAAPLPSCRDCSPPKVSTSPTHVLYHISHCPRVTPYRLQPGWLGRFFEGVNKTLMDGSVGEILAPGGGELQPRPRKRPVVAVYGSQAAENTALATPLGRWVWHA